MSKWASVVIDATDYGFGILDVKGHETLTAAKAFAFDEILRMAEDFCEGDVRKLKLSFYNDKYEHQIMKIESDSGDVTLVKCKEYEDEENCC